MIDAHLNLIVPDSISDLADTIRLKCESQPTPSFSTHEMEGSIVAVPCINVNLFIGYKTRTTFPPKSESLT